MRARALVAGFPDGVFYLDLAPIDGLEAVVTELAGILDVRLPPDGDAATATTALLSTFGIDAACWSSTPSTDTLVPRRSSHA